MPVKALTPLLSVSEPALAPVIAQVFARLLPVNVSVPVPPPLIVPLTRPVPESTKLSSAVPPVTFSMPVKTLAPLASVSVPALAALIAQVLVRLFPVSVSLPVPPAIVPLMRPAPESVKLSSAVPPVRFAKSVKEALLSVPALSALIAHVLLLLGPARASSASVPPEMLMFAGAAKAPLAVRVSALSLLLSTRMLIVFVVASMAAVATLPPVLTLMFAPTVTAELKEMSPLVEVIFPLSVVAPV